MKQHRSLLSYITLGFRYVLISPIWLYRTLISPLLPARCIYDPTCSHYATQAIRQHGLRGVLLALARVFRCIGGFYQGGEDPVPLVFTFRSIADGYRKHWIGRGKPR